MLNPHFMPNRAVAGLLPYRPRLVSAFQPCQGCGFGLLSLFTCLFLPSPWPLFLPLALDIFLWAGQLILTGHGLPHSPLKLFLDSFRLRKDSAEFLQ